MTTVRSFQWTPDEPELLAWGTVSEDFNPLHFDDEFCRRTSVGRRVVFGALVLARVQAESRGWSSPGLPRSVTLRFLAPMPVGSELAVTLESVNGTVQCTVSAEGRVAATGSVTHPSGGSRAAPDQRSPTP
jgi:acyl dehydratase